MQPNQQNQYEQPGVPPAPTSGQPSVGTELDPYERPLTPSSPQRAIPEYLHFEPVADPIVVSGKRKKRIKLVAAIVLVIIGLLAIVGVAYYFLVYNSAQQTLYKALENSMQSSYITKKFELDEVTTSDKGTISADSHSDFSNTSSPKSQLSYVYNSPNKTVDKGDIVVLDSQKFYSKLAQSSSDIKRRNLALGVWYTVDSTYVGSTRYALDVLDLHDAINTPLGFIIEGNLSKERRSLVVDSIKRDNIYNVKSTSSEQLDGKRLTVYTVDIDTAKLKILTDKLATQMKIKSPTTTLAISNLNSGVKFWVDDSSQQIVKMNFSTKYSPGDIALSGDVLLSYPTSESIGAPERIGS